MFRLTFTLLALLLAVGTLGAPTGEITENDVSTEDEDVEDEIIAAESDPGFTGGDQNPEPALASEEENVEEGEPADESNESESEAKPDPPNEWGTYYNLPSIQPLMLDLFQQAYDADVNSANPHTECRENDADFERWYNSSKNEDHVILSYYCRTKAARGYEHMKVSVSKANLIDFQTSLKDFAITDAGDYEQELGDEESEKLRDELLPAVVEEIGNQREDTAERNELCPNPGTETLATVSLKQENGLYYYKFGISCNVTFNPEGYASHMSHIEVVVDKNFGVLNGGLPTLASMEMPTRNSEYVRKQIEEEEESMKQTGTGEALFPPFITLISVSMIIPSFQLFI